MSEEQRIPSASELFNEVEDIFPRIIKLTGKVDDLETKAHCTEILLGFMLDYIRSQYELTIEFQPEEEEEEDDGDGWKRGMRYDK